MPYHKARDSKLDLFHNLDKGNIKKEWLFHTKHCIREGSMYTVCKIMASDASQKKNDNKVNTTAGPPSLDLFTRPHLWQISGGGGCPELRPPSGSALVSHGMCGTLCIVRELNRYIVHVNYKKSFSLL